MITKNLILNTDSYKPSHWIQLPKGTQTIYSYIESRGGLFDETLFFGLQIFLKEYLSKPITKENIEEAESFWPAHGEPFNKEGWTRILNKFGGYLPLQIKAINEGMVIPTHNVLVSVENTHEDFAWVTSYIETSLLRAVWYPTTVATISWQAKQIMLKALNKSCDNPNSVIDFMLHDFGARGVSSDESAGIGGAAHLVNFKGSDTVTGVRYANYYYNAGMAGFSIPAMEHQTVTTWGQNGEADSFSNMLNVFGKKGAIIACVSDSYNLWSAVSNIWGDALKEKLIKSGARVVVRPDSGDPLTVPIEVIKLLGEKFGYTVNSKGYKVLPDCVRVIQGDGITIDSIPVILQNVMDAGWSAENLAMGMGGGLLQQCNRDTQKFAMKCSAAKINGGWEEVFKNPITDPGKRSKRGMLVVYKEDGKIITGKKNNGHDWEDWLHEVYLDGELKNVQNFERIRELSNTAFY
jgi:nicotinamide phosphoribosyltransferase